MRRFIIVASLAAVTLCGLDAGAATKGKQLVCWTDKTGARACGDSVPPEYSSQQRDVLNAQGQVIGTMARQKTPAELAEDERQAAAAAAEQQRRMRQVAYDNYMLQSYESVTQLQRVRDENIKTVEGRLALAEKGVPNAEAAVNSARARATAETEKDAKDHVTYAAPEDCRDPQEIKDKLAARAAKLPPPKPVKGAKAPPAPKEPPELKAAREKWDSRECGDVRRTRQLGLYEQGLVDALKAVQSLKKQRDDTNSRFEHDVARFKALKAHQIEIGSVDPNNPYMGTPAPPTP